MRWQYVLFLAGVVTTACAFALRPMVREKACARTRQAVADAQVALDNGDITRALELAQSTVERARRMRNLLGESLFCLGLVRERQAERAVGPDRVVYCTAATQHFQEALHVGVAAEVRPELNFHLAKCLHAKHQFAECVPLLEQSMTEFPAGRAEAIRLLTEVFLSREFLDLPRASRLNAELCRLPNVAPSVIVHAWSTRADILTRLGRPDLLAGLELGGSAAAPHWTAPLLIACDAHESKQYDSAIAAYKNLLSLKSLPQPVERRTWFLMALAARDSGDDELALSTLRAVKWRFPSTEEARAAAAHAAAIALRQGNPEQAIALLRRAAADTDSNSVLMGRITLGKLLTHALERLRDEKQFEAAVELLDVHRRVESTENTDLIAAETYEAWAATLLREAERVATHDAEQTRYRAEERYRAAGNLLLRVADAAKRPDDARSHLWRAAQNFVRGNGHLAAVTACDRFLATGVMGDARADALALMCAALEGCGQYEQVENTATQCLREFPDHPATLKALYHLARCEIAVGEIDTAAAKLSTVVASATSETDPTVVERSRIYLAHLLIDRGRHADAIPLLRELVAHPTRRDVVPEAKFLLANCLRAAARRPIGRISAAQTPETRLFYQQQRNRELDEALELLSSAERELAALEHRGPLTPRHDEALRECRTAMADCLYEAERYEEAIALFEAIAETYSDLRFWLDAQVQIGNCHYRLGQTEQARQILRAAQERIDRTPDDVVQQARAGMAPERWAEWVDWLRRL